MPKHEWFDPKNIWFRQKVEICISVNQERRNFGYDKAGMAHETSPKSSVSEFLGGLISFPDFMIFIPVKDRFDPCPLCNAFSHIYQDLIFHLNFLFTIDPRCLFNQFFSIWVVSRQNLNHPFQEYDKWGLRLDIEWKWKLRGLEKTEQSELDRVSRFWFLRFLWGRSSVKVWKTRWNKDFSRKVRVKPRVRSSFWLYFKF